MCKTKIILSSSVENKAMCMKNKANNLIAEQWFYDGITALWCLVGYISDLKMIVFWMWIQ